MCARVCVCVCVCERERERECVCVCGGREREREKERGLIWLEHACPITDIKASNGAVLETEVQAFFSITVRKSTNFQLQARRYVT